METLDQRIARLKAQKEAMEAQENFDVNEYNKIVNELSEAEYEQNQQLAKEQLVQQVEQQAQEKLNAPIAFAIEGVDMKSLPVEVINLANKLVMANRETLVNEQKDELLSMQDKHNNELAGYRERELQIQRQNRELQSQAEEESALLAQAVRDRDENKKLADQNKAERDDFEKKLENAAAEIDSLSLQLETKEQEIQQMRAASHFGEKKSQAIIDVTPNKDDIQSAVDAVAKLFVSAQPIGAGLYQAVTYSDGSSEVLHKSEVDKIQPANAVSPFPDSQPQNDTVHNGDTQATIAQVQPPALEVTQFPTQEVHTSTDGLANQEPGVQDAGAVTRQEFEALKQRVVSIERHANLPGVA